MPSRTLEKKLIAEPTRLCDVERTETGTRRVARTGSPRLADWEAQVVGFVPAKKLAGLLGRPHNLKVPPSLCGVLSMAGESVLISAGSA